jgi:hypothetical protein
MDDLGMVFDLVVVKDWDGPRARVCKPVEHDPAWVRC